jgi:hypothetical protein
VRKLTAGTEVVVTVQGSQPSKRYVVQADDSDLTVLNLTDPTLPRAARRALLDMASNQPEYFKGQKGAFVDKEVRVGPDGVFVADRKVADLGQIVERIPRTDVSEIRSPVRTSGSVGSTVTGVAVGSGLGLVGFFSVFDCPGQGNCGAWQLRRSSLLWAPIVGGFSGYWATRHKTEHVIYRAP